MALIWTDGFDAYTVAELNARYVTIGGSNAFSFGSPGRIGYGQFIEIPTGNSITAAIPTSLTTIIVGCAIYYPYQNLPTFGGGGPQCITFVDSNGNVLSTLQVGPLGQLGLCLGITGSPSLQTANGLFFAETWAYIEVSITLSNAGGGALTVRLNGQTVFSQSSVTTSGSTTGAPCAGVALAGPNFNAFYFDDWYILNTTAPNNAFFGDVKVLPLYPNGNGRISGFGRFGGTSSGNYTAVQEHPPDGDTSYVYTATPGTSDAYTLTTLSNVTTIKAVQVSAFARKDDTPSRVLALGVGNGSVENYDSGHSLNTTYTYIERQMDINPLTSAAWAVTDFNTLQLAQQLIS